MKVKNALIGILLALVTSCAVHPLTPTPEPTATLPEVAVVMATFTPTVAPPASATPLLTETAEPTAESVIILPTTQPAIVAPPTTVPQVLVAPPPAEDVAAAEQYTIDLINAQRTAAGVAPLSRDETLMSIARARVQDMIARGYTGHNDPATGEPMARTMIRAAGYTSSYIGENWYGSVKALPAIVDVAMGWFMTDPPHSKNILSPNYVAVGVGIGFNGRQWLLIQNFAGVNL